MAYVPDKAKWYLADIVEQVTVEGDPRNVVHINTVLIRGNSPEEAYLKALELGINGQTSYENTDGKSVTITYRGLRDLNVIYDELEHGAELTFTEHIETDEAAIQQYVSPKEALGVFATRKPSQAPDYKSREVLETLHKMFRNVNTSEHGAAE